MKKLPETWIVDRKLDWREREVLFVLAESAGLNVFTSTRTNEEMDKYPFIFRDRDSWINATKYLTSDRLPLPYETIIEALKQMIKDREVPEYE